MRHGRFILLLLASLCWSVSGCALTEHSGEIMLTGYDEPVTSELPGASMPARGKLQADASALSTAPRVDGLLKTAETPPAAQYVALSAPDLQCLAAARSSLAALIEMERGIAADTTRGCLHHKPTCEADMKDDLLALRAVEERNRAAGTALELYYRLAEAEAGLDSIKQSQQGLDQALANIAEIRGQGMKVEIDEQALHRRKLELLDQQAEAELGREQAHGGLKVLLNLAEEDPTRIWPAADLRATLEPLDVHAAVAEGLAARVELIILRCLVESLTVQTLPGARAALAQRDSSLGTSSLDMRKLHLLLAGTRGASELPGRRAQLAQLLAERERTIAEEIRAGVTLVGARLKQVAVAKEILDGRREHLTELERRREIGSATPFDIAAEKLEITKAEAEVMRKIIAWRIAQVKLRQSQGILAGECGYHHTPCCQTCGRTCGRRGCNSCSGTVSTPGHQLPTMARTNASSANSGPRIVKLDSGKQTPLPSLARSVLTQSQVEQAASRPTIKRLK